MNTRVQILAACAAVSFLATSSVRAEEKISLDKAPAAVQETVKKIVGTAPMGDFVKETEEGKTQFEAEFKVGDVQHSATISEDGKVIEEEEDVKAADLPAAVSAAIAKAAPTGKVGDASIVKADGKTYYEADVKVGEEKHEIKVATDGTVTSNKVEKDEEDEKDDGKENKEEKK